MLRYLFHPPYRVNTPPDPISPVPISLRLAPLPLNGHRRRSVRSESCCRRLFMSARSHPQLVSFRGWGQAQEASILTQLLCPCPKFIIFRSVGTPVLQTRHWSRHRSIGLSESLSRWNPKRDIFVTGMLYSTRVFLELSTPDSISPLNMVSSSPNPASLERV